MKKSRGELKAELMKAAEITIDKLLAWKEESEQPKLKQIEEIVLELRQQLSEKMTAAVLDSQEAVRPVPGPVCHSCHQEMRYKGMYAKTVSSWVGEIKLERAYFYCDRCKRGLFPPG